MAGEVSQHLSDRIRHRLQGVNLLELGATDRDLRQALNDLNHPPSVCARGIREATVQQRSAKVGRLLSPS